MAPRSPTRRRVASARRREAPILAVSGASGAGKTRLLSRLIPALARRGVTTAVLKHTRHPHPFDRPGKDTEVLRRAGAVAAAIEGPEELAFFGPPVGGLRALARLLPEVDLVLAEGWKTAPLPRVEVHRREVSPEFLCARDRRVFAVVTDEAPPRAVRVFGDGEEEALADLVCARFGLGGKPRTRERLRVRPTVSSVRAEGSGRRVAPRKERRMAKTTSRKSSSAKRGGRRSGASRSGAGRKGGKATLRARGPEFYSEIGRKGGSSRGKKTGARSTRSTSRSGGRGKASTRSRSGARGGTRSKRGGRASSR